MANEKKDLKKLTEENKQSVVGGNVYAGRNAAGNWVYYVPHPNKRTNRSLAYDSREAAQNEASRIGQDNTVIDCVTATAAKRRSDAELGRLVRGSNQPTITSFFTKNKANM